MTKIVNKDELVFVGDCCVYMTKEDMSKYTRIIAQKETEETTYIIEKRINQLPQLKTGYSFIILSESIN
jgi:hypothetical protein